MTQLNDIFSARILVSKSTTFPANEPAVYEDITSGIMNVNIKTGVDYFEGPWQQPDTGQFTLITRNPNLDPKINPNIKYDSIIEFLDSRDTNERPFFRGYVTDINVEYVRNDNPIITITGTDTLGLLQRILITPAIEQDCIYDGDEDGISFEKFASVDGLEELILKYFNFYFVQGENTVGGSLGSSVPAYRPAKFFPKAGENLLEIITRYAETNLDFISVSYSELDEYDTVNINPFPKYNTDYWSPQQDPALEFPTYQFSSDPADERPYETILVDNGYNRVTNQLEFSNEYRTIVAGVPESTNESFGTYISEYSVDEWAITKTSISTYFPASKANEGEMERYARDIFQIVAFPTDQIQNITFNNARIEDIESDYTYSNFKIRQFVRIKHQLSESETIDRVYDIAGITHNISPNEWTMGFNFKPSEQELAFTYQGQPPTIQMNAFSGDTNFNFTATIVNFPTETIEVVFWCLNGIQYDLESEWPMTYDGTRYKNNTPRNNLTQTWNFDDDGILNPNYDGPGYWHVIPYITLTNGWVTAPGVMLTVGAPTPEADFTWSQNLTNNFGQVTFTDASRNNEPDEPNSYLWNFGDGTTSTLQNPVHTYDPGPNQTTYSVSLTVFALFGGGTNTHTETITLSRPTMVPNFTWVTNNQIVTFTNTSTNVGLEEPDAYLWNFGDGTTSILKNPVHTFPVTNINVPQSFSVILTTRNIWEQTASTTKTVTTTGLNKSGTLPVDTIRLRFEPVTNSGAESAIPLYFYMFDLKARTSTTRENLSYLKPTTRINSANITWYEADGTVAESNDPLNLTRDSSITPNDQYGLSPFGTNTSSATLDFKLDTEFSSSTNLINDILLTLRDVGTTNNILYPTGSNRKLFVDVSDSFGGWVNIGYYQILTTRVNPGITPPGAVTQAIKTMTALRPMPMNIPYFKYTFNNRVASFTSIETADSYAWNFGDGTTSTLKDPVHTFPSRGTYTVSLAVTNGGVVTRTTTEPVIVEYLAAYPLRYFKLVQNLHTGTHAFDTPYIDSFSFKQDYVGLSENSLTFAKTDIYPNQYRVGTGGTVIINPLTSPNNSRLNGGNGLRVKSLDASNRTQWEMILDMGSVQNNLTNCSISLGRWTADGYPATVAAGINYSVYITNFTGTQANIGTATWTKLGDFTPTSMPLNNSTTYNIILT